MKENWANRVKPDLIGFFEMNAIWHTFVQNPNTLLVIASYLVTIPSEYSTIPIDSTCRIFTNSLYQKNCGACAAFAVSTLVSMQACLYHNEDYIPSPFRIFDCSHATCSSGLAITTAAAIVNFGIEDIAASAEFYGLQCNLQPEHQHTQIHITRLTMTVPAQIKTAILYFGPVIGFIGNAMLQHPETGIYHPLRGSAPSDKQHAVVVVGWDKDDNWIIQNSWGNDWGDGKGRGRISQELLMNATDPTVSATLGFCKSGVLVCFIVICIMELFEKYKTKINRPIESV